MVQQYFPARMLSPVAAAGIPLISELIPTLPVLLYHLSHFLLPYTVRELTTCLSTHKVNNVLVTQ